MYDLIYFADDQMVVSGLEDLKMASKIRMRQMPDCIYIQPIIKEEQTSLYGIFQGITDPEFKRIMYNYLANKKLQGIEFVQIGTGYYERFARAAENTQKHIDITCAFLLENSCPEYIMII